MVKTKKALIDRKLLSSVIEEILSAYNIIEGHANIIKNNFAIQAIMATDYSNYQAIENELGDLIYDVKSKLTALVQTLTQLFEIKTLAQIRKVFNEFSTNVIRLADSIIPYIANEIRRNDVIHYREQIQHLQSDTMKELNRIDRIPVQKIINVNYQLKIA